MVITTSWVIHSEFSEFTALSTRKRLFASVYYSSCALGVTIIQLQIGIAAS